MRLALSILLLTCWSAFAANDPVPSDRLPYAGTWSGIVGVKGGIPARTDVYTTLSSGATIAQIETALADAASNQVVKLNAGTYTFNGGDLDLVNFKTLRGTTNASGYPTTILRWTSAGEVWIGDGAWDVSNSGQFTARTISGTPTRGDVAITLTAAPTGLTEGTVMWILANNTATLKGACWCDWNGDGEYPLGIACYVTNVSGSTVGFEPPLNHDYIPANPIIWYRAASYYTTLAGLEDVRVEHADNVSGTLLNFRGSIDCWARNVWTTNVSGNPYHHIWMYATYRTEIRDCDVCGVYDLSVPWATYGISAVQSCNALVVNSMFHHIPNVMAMFGLGSSAYVGNYAVDMYYGASPWLSQIVFFHGSHNSYNLFEGNWIPRCYHDSDYDAPASMKNVFLRNRILGQDPTAGYHTAFVAVDDNHEQMVHAGNVLGHPTYHTIWWRTNSDDFGDTVLYGVGLGSSNSFLRFTNWNVVTPGTPVEERLAPSSNIVDSYIYASKPAWFGDRQWPTVQPTSVVTNTLYYTNLPSGYRYQYGGFPPAEGNPAPRNLRVIGSLRAGTLRGP